MMKGRRFISILLCILMCVSMFPVQAFAEEETEIFASAEVQEPEKTEEAEEAEVTESAETGEEIPETVPESAEIEEEVSGDPVEEIAIPEALPESAEIGGEISGDPAEETGIPDTAPESAEIGEEMSGDPAEEIVTPDLPESAETDENDSAPADDSDGSDTEEAEAQDANPVYEDAEEEDGVVCSPDLLYSDAVEICAGEHLTAEILIPGEEACFTIVPELSGYYTFSSDEGTEATGRLLNAAGNVLAENDDENFAGLRISAELEAGARYYVLAGFRDASAAGSFGVSLESEEEWIGAASLDGEGGEEGLEEGEGFTSEALFDLSANYIETATGGDGNGTVDVTARYRVAADDYAAFSAFTLFITLPQNAEVSLSSIEQNYSAAKNVSLEEGNRLCVLLEDAEGYVSFPMSVSVSGTVQLSSEISCVIEGETYCRNLETVSARVNLFHVEAQHQGGTQALFSGAAPAGSEIQVYFGETRLACFFAGEDRGFSGVVSSDGWAEGTARTFRVVLVAGSYTETRSLSVYRKSETPSLRAFRYYDHEGADCLDLYSSIQNGVPVNITYADNDEPFRFEIEYNNSASISRLYVTARRDADGATYSVEAVRAEGEDGLFIAEGYFVAGNKHFTPDHIGLEYDRGASRTVDAEALAAVEENGQLYTVISDSLPEINVTPGEANTETESTYTVEFPESSDGDLAKTAIEYSIKVFDKATGLDMFNHYKNDLHWVSYIVPGLDDDQYFMNLDFSDPNTLKICIVDTSKVADAAVELIVDCYDRTDTREAFLKWSEISERVGDACSIIGTVAEMYDISRNIEEIRENIDNSTSMTAEQKEEAHGKADELYGDQMAFLLLTTMMPVIVGTGGMAAPVALFGVMIAAMGMASDYFYDNRIAAITDVGVSNDAKLRGQMTLTGNDGLTYSYSYALTDVSYMGEEGMINALRMDIGDVRVSGIGYSEVGWASMSAAQIVGWAQQHLQGPSLYLMNGKRYWIHTNGIQNLIYEEGITRLPYDLFDWDCIRHLVIPSTATESLPDYANCTRLRSAGPTDDFDIVFHWSSIPDHAFRNAHITHVMLPADCESIGISAFIGCSELAYISLVDGLTTIGVGAFTGCASLKSITIPVTLTYAPAAFEDSGVAYANFAEGRTVIPRRLFYGCQALKKVDFPNTLTTVDYGAFENTGLLSLDLTQFESITLGEDSFYGCSCLQKVRLPRTVKVDDRGYHYGSPFGACSALKTAGPAGGDYDIEFRFDTGIPAYLFEKSCLQSVVLPAGMKTIGSYAFCDSELKELHLPDGMKSIGAYAFSGTKLKNLVLPDSVTWIGDHAFSCESLETVHFPANAGGSGSDYMSTAFQDVDELVVSADDLASGTMFSFFSSLSRLRVADGVTAVTDPGVPSVKKIYLPGTVTKFTFVDDRTAIHDIYYAGTAGQLSLVNAPAAVKVHYGVSATTWEETREEELAAPELSFDVSEGTVIITWTAVEGAERYWIYRDGSPIASTMQTEYTDTVGQGVEYTSYTYAVRCLSSDLRGGSSSSGTVSIMPDAEVAGSGDLGDAQFVMYTSGIMTIYGNGKAWLPDSNYGLSLYFYDQNWEEVPITSIVVQEGITELGSGTCGLFDDAWSLREVSLPASLTRINAKAFINCDSIQTVRYAGSNEQWQTVQVDEGNDCLLDADDYYFNGNKLLRYTVVFDGNPRYYGDDDLMPKQRILCGESVKLRKNLLTRTDLVFAGWNTASDGSGTRYADEALVTDIGEPGETVTLYAQWREGTQNIQAYIKGTDGEKQADYEIDYGMPIHLEVETPDVYEDPLTYTWEIDRYNWETGAFDDIETIAGSDPWLDLESVTITTIVLCYVSTEYTHFPVRIRFDISVHSGFAIVPGDSQTVYVPSSGQCATLQVVTNSAHPEHLHYQWYDASNNYEKIGEDSPTLVTAPIEKTVFYYCTVCNELGEWADVHFTVRIGTTPAVVRYTIRFDGNGASGAMDDVGATKDVPLSLPENSFARVGYTFTGWNTRADGKGTSYAAGAEVKNLTTTNGAVVTLYAMWKAISYTVVFDANTGTGTMKNQTLSYDKAAALTANVFKKTNWQFVGWSKDPGAKEPMYLDKQSVLNLTAEPGGTVTLYAVWIKNGYCIVFNANGGTGDMSEDGGYCEYDETYTLPICTFERAGFEFRGWATSAKGNVAYSDGQKISGLTKTNGKVVTLYAVWKAYQYRIVFDGNGATSGAMKPMNNCVCGKAYTLTANAFKRTGYTFLGWSENPYAEEVTYKNKAKQSNFSTSDGAVVTLYAVWTPTEYKITYKNVVGTDGNRNPDSYRITDETIVLQGLSRPGCTFEGWYLDSKFKKPVMEIASGSTGAKTFYAKWSGTAAKYTVVFDPNGGTGKMAPLAMSCGKAKALTANTFKRTGYTFAAWNTAADGSGTTYKNKQSVLNLSETENDIVTLYAVWEPVVYKITYKNVGLFDTNRNPADYTVESPVDFNHLDAPERPGCAFGGWYTDSKFKKPAETATFTSTGAKTLYAKWDSKVTYSIVFDKNADEATGKMKPMTKLVNGTVYTLTANAFKRTGYTFLGWSTDPNAKIPEHLNKAKVGNLAFENGATVTLYAVWEPTVYSITWKNVADVRVPDKTTYTIEDEIFELPSLLLKEGYVFLGWYTSSSFKADTRITQIGPGATGDKTLYAKWMLCS